MTGALRSPRLPDDLGHHGVPFEFSILADGLGIPGLALHPALRAPRPCALSWTGPTASQVLRLHPDVGFLEIATSWAPWDGDIPGLATISRTLSAAAQVLPLLLGLCKRPPRSSKLQYKLGTRVVVPRLGSIGSKVWEPLVCRTRNPRFQDWEAFVPRFGNQQIFKLETCGPTPCHGHRRDEWTIIRLHSLARVPQSQQDGSQRRKLSIAQITSTVQSVQLGRGSDRPVDCRTSLRSGSQSHTFTSSSRPDGLVDTNDAALARLTVKEVRGPTSGMVVQNHIPSGTQFLAKRLRVEDAKRSFRARPPSKPES